MSDHLIPDATQVAAKRGFIRTTAQAYRTSLAGGLSATAIITSLEGGPNWMAIGVTAAVTVLSPLLAGLASYFSILSKGIPEDYQQPSA